MLWQIYVFPRPGQPDLEGRRVAAEISELGSRPVHQVRFARGYLIEGAISRAGAERIGHALLTDPVIEDFSLNDEPALTGAATEANSSVANVILKPGVMDPVAHSVTQAIRQLGFQPAAVHTLRRYWIEGADGPEQRQNIATRVLANDAIEHVVWGPLPFTHLAQGQSYRFEIIRIPIREMTDTDLERASQAGQLSLSLTEMQVIQQHFREVGRDPTDAELETIAQTWSEHCSHKTLRGRISYEEADQHGEITRREQFQDLLKETIFKATQDIRHAWGPERDWCVSVFKDNAGVVRFDDSYNVCFKVETHNHPSAIEPYGGANTGLGGVLRDSMGTGLGAKPIANTDVFCFAPPDYPSDRLPPGVLHPRRVMRGVVAGVRDYGNRMGIPTVNGAIYFDERYLGNPLVFCGSVGLLPRDRSQKEPKPGDLIVAIGGRTGRDGIHGATFSSIELTHESETVSGGAVQIGNAITEKMMLDVLLQARDRGLYHSITDCGAGGFSSAVGEMGADIGAEVWLERVPLKYQGLSYSEIWISEAQERMVLAVPEATWPEFESLARSESVEATVIGRFVPTGRLTLKFHENVVGDLSMRFLHKGRPAVVRKALYRHTELVQSGAGDASNQVKNQTPRKSPPPAVTATELPFGDTLRRILSAWNVCSKEWVIRQYDHEVQGGSVIKPLVGAENDGPSDAAVIRPVLASYRGLAIACGMNPRYGDIDPYWMAANAIDEAIRNCVAVGADPGRIAILDNFCWGNTERPEELGKLVRAAIACRDAATTFGTPFISGKDSLNNEFRLQGAGLALGDNGASAGTGRIVIPPTLLVSAIGQVEDVRQCVTMDLKQPGNLIYLVGTTLQELGGSHYELVTGQSGGEVPKVNAASAIILYRRLHQAFRQSLVRACHDLSEGGLAVALAEMAFAGGFGAKIDLQALRPATADDLRGTTRGERMAEQAQLLFSESSSRFIVEISPESNSAFVECMTRESPMPLHLLGEVTDSGTLEITDRAADRAENFLLRESVKDLKECWQRPLRW